MKLRLLADSLRLRLSPDDVATLGATGRVLVDVAFDATSRVLYELCAVPGAKQLTASFNNGMIRVEVPFDVAAKWAGSSQVGMESTQPAGGGRTLRILIEKDFECLHNESNEPGQTFFPNPLLSD